jgi:hypothetical protein
VIVSLFSISGRRNSDVMTIDDVIMTSLVAVDDDGEDEEEEKEYDAMMDNKDQGNLG